MRKGVTEETQTLNLRSEDATLFLQMLEFRIYWRSTALWKGSRRVVGVT